MKYLLQFCAEGAGDAEGGVQGGGVAALLDGDDGLAGEADQIGELLLGHFAVLEAPGAYLIGDLGIRHRQAPRRS